MILPAARRALSRLPRANPRPARRLMSTQDKFNRPMPHPLPPAQQREFEDLIRAANEGASHPDTPRPVQPTFEGDVNPYTGERGGPKREPVQRWSEDDPEWSLKGRVSDF